MNCSRNDVVLLPIPFTDLTSRKVRPAVVIGRNGADLFLVPISSVLANTEFPLKEWRAALALRKHLIKIKAVPKVFPRIRPPVQHPCVDQVKNDLTEIFGS